MYYIRTGRRSGPFGNTSLSARPSTRHEDGPRGWTERGRRRRRRGRRRGKISPLDSLCPYETIIRRRSKLLLRSALYSLLSWFLRPSRCGSSRTGELQSTQGIKLSTYSGFFFFFFFFFFKFCSLSILLFLFFFIFLFFLFSLSFSALHFGSILSCSALHVVCSDLVFCPFPFCPAPLFFSRFFCSLPFTSCVCVFWLKLATPHSYIIHLRSVFPLQSFLILQICRALICTIGFQEKGKYIPMRKLGSPWRCVVLW